MRTISVFYDGKQFTYRWLSTLVWAKDEFKQEQIQINKIKLPHLIEKDRFKAIEKKILKCKYDIIFLAFHRTSFFFKRPEERIIEFLKKVKGQCNLLVWLDTSDGTGTSQFELLEYVDLYLKKQLLRNKQLYMNNYAGERVYLDYYYKENVLPYESKFNSRRSSISNESFLEKLNVSWNIGLGDYFSSKLRFIFNYSRNNDYKFKLSKRKRTIDLHFRGGISDNNIGYQRKIALKTILFSGLVHPNYDYNPSHKKYMHELEMSKFVVSPFGYGEICVRDFEAFYKGCVLFKPNMDHLVTYPNYYIDGKTYVSVKWDFSDAVEKYNQHIKNKYEIIAKNGYKIYQDSLSSDGKKDFVRHIKKVLGI